MSILAGLAVAAEGRTAPGIPAALVDMEVRTSELSHQAIFKAISASASDNNIAVLKVQPNSDKNVVSLAEIFTPESFTLPSKFFEPGRSAELFSRESLANSRAGGRYVVYGETSGAKQLAQDLHGLGVVVTPFYPEYRDSLRVFIGIPVVSWVVASLVLLVSSSGMLLAVSEQKRQAILTLNGVSSAAILRNSFLRFMTIFFCSFAAVFSISVVLVSALRGAEFVDAYVRYFIAPAWMSLTASTLISALWAVLYRIRSKTPLERTSDNKKVARMAVRHSFVATVAVGLALSSSVMSVQQAAAVQRSLSFWDELEQYVAVAIILSTTEEDIASHITAMGQVIKNADSHGALALSFNVNEAIRHNENEPDDDAFPGDTILVDEAYLKLLDASVVQDLRSLEQHPSKVRASLDKYLNDLWSAKPKRPWQEVEREIQVMQYSGSSGMPVMSIGGGMTFPKEATVVVIPPVSGYLNVDNIISLMSSGNIFFKGKEDMIQSLSDVGLGDYYRVEKISEGGQNMAAFERFRYIFLILTSIVAGLSAMLTGFLAARTYMHINQTKVQLGWLHGHTQLKMFAQRWLRDAVVISVALLPSVAWLVYRQNVVGLGVVLFGGVLLWLVSCLSIKKAAQDICVDAALRRA